MVELNTQAKYKEVIKLAELLNVPIVTAAGHGDAIPFNHKLNAGQMGPRGNPVASKLVKEADVIVAQLGPDLGFNSTFYSYDNINKKAKIIQIEIRKKNAWKIFSNNLLELMQMQLQLQIRYMMKLKNRKLN